MEGLNDGSADGFDVGDAVGVVLGMSEGLSEGVEEGISEGVSDGVFDDLRVGLVDGDNDSVGPSDGTCEGAVLQGHLQQVVVHTSRAALYPPPVSVLIQKFADLPFGFSANHLHVFVTTVTLPLLCCILWKNLNCGSSGTAQTSAQLSVGETDGKRVGETDGWSEIEGVTDGTREGATVQGQRQHVVVQTSHAAL